MAGFQESSGGSGTYQPSRSLELPARPCFRPVGTGQEDSDTTSPDAQVRQESRDGGRSQGSDLLPGMRQTRTEKKSAVFQNRAGPGLRQGQRERKICELRVSNLPLPKLRARVQRARMVLWSRPEMGLEHACLLRLPHRRVTRPATHGATQPEQAVRLRPGPEYAEQPQDQSVRLLFSHQKEDSEPDHPRESHSRRRDPGQHQRASGLRVGSDESARGGLYPRREPRGRNRSGIAERISTASSCRISTRPTTLSPVPSRNVLSTSCAI